MLTLDALRAYGADVDDGLKRCMNMEAFYLKLVGSLRGSTRVEELAEAVARKDLGRAFDLAHSLKGVYANLSLTPILGPVSEITELLRAGTEMDYSPLMAEILEQKARLDALLEG